jgi:hypothetical protein
VCFSFGWVSYAFMALVETIGDGRLLPPPDYPVKVFNLKSGYARDNKNWVIGRLLRDIEASVSRDGPADNSGFRISIFEAAKNPNGLTHFPFTSIHLFGLLFIVLQFGLAIIPIVRGGEWDVMLIVAVGTCLTQMAGCLPQWRAEKLPNRQRCSSTYALTQGNGSCEVVVILGNGNSLDLEELSTPTSPRGGRPWEKFVNSNIFSQPQIGPDGRPEMPRANTQLRKARIIRGFPLGFWISRVVSVSQAVLWLLLLVNVAIPRNYNWLLLAIGGLGMFQNGYMAGMEHPYKRRNLYLVHKETITAKKVMDVIMDFHVLYKCGKPLLHEFFPGDLLPYEKGWWEGKREMYDAERRKAPWRGTPRSAKIVSPPANDKS